MITDFKQLEKELTSLGYTEETWNSMEQEEREMVIKNCL